MVSAPERTLRESFAPVPHMPTDRRLQGWQIIIKVKGEYLVGGIDDPEPYGRFLLTPANPHSLQGDLSIYHF